MMFLCHHACTAPSKACCCGSLSHCPVISSAQATTQSLLSHMQNGADQRNWRVSAYERKKEKEAGGRECTWLWPCQWERDRKKKRKMKSAISAVARAVLHQAVTLGYCPLPWVWQTMTCLRSIAAGLSLYLIIITAQKHFLYLIDMYASMQRTQISSARLTHSNCSFISSSREDPI